MATQGMKRNEKRKAAQRIAAHYQRRLASERKELAKYKDGKGKERAEAARVKWNHSVLAAYEQHLERSRVKNDKRS